MTHSSLPRWLKSRGVTVSYTLLPKKHAAITPNQIRTAQWGTQLDESISWQPLSASSVTVLSARRLNTPSGIAGEANGELVPDLCGDTFTYGERASLMYSRRGSGWAGLLSSTWEILGYGIDPPSKWGHEHVRAEEGDSWIVIYVAETLFTPAGLNIFCRSGKLSGETVDAITSGLAGIGGEITDLAQRVFEIAQAVKVDKAASLNS